MPIVAPELETENDPPRAVVMLPEIKADTDPETPIPVVNVPAEAATAPELPVADDTVPDVEVTTDPAEPTVPPVWLLVPVSKAVDVRPY